MYPPDRGRRLLVSAQLPLTTRARLSPVAKLSLQGLGSGCLKAGAASAAASVPDEAAGERAMKFVRARPELAAACGASKAQCKLAFKAGEVLVNGAKAEETKARAGHDCLGCHPANDARGTADRVGSARPVQTVRGFIRSTGQLRWLLRKALARRAKIPFEGLLMISFVVRSPACLCKLESRFVLVSTCFFLERRSLMGFGRGCGACLFFRCCKRGTAWRWYETRSQRSDSARCATCR